MSRQPASVRAYRINSYPGSSIHTGLPGSSSTRAERSSACWEPLSTMICRAGGPQVSGDRFAKVFGTHRVAVVERAGAHLSRMTRDQIRPYLEGKAVKRQLTHAERARTIRPWRTLAAEEKCATARDRGGAGGFACLPVS